MWQQTATLLGSKLDYKIVEKVIDSDGRFIILKSIIQGQEFLLINSYLPNIEKEQVTLLKNILRIVESTETNGDTQIVWGGDFNFVMDLELEAIGGNPKLKVSSIEQLLAIKQDLDLCDIWRVRNPEAKRFTWNGHAQGTASYRNQKLYRRLDYFFISDHLQTSVKEINITVAPATDHSALIMKLNSLPENKYGPSFWKLNNSLLNDNNYVEKIKDVISQTKTDFMEKDITSPNLRWELLKYEIRKASISFSKAKAKTFRSDVKDLEKKLEEIERKENWFLNETSVRNYETIKVQLNERSNYITEGLIIRSKVRWFEQGEKSNKYFLNLQKHRKSKTHVRKIIDEDGKEITNPKLILENLKQFYGEIYERKNSYSEKECLDYTNQVKTTTKLSEEDRNEIDSLLSIRECYESLEKMANNKTPGNDGLPKEFYFTFWNELGQEMVNSFNYSFEKGLLTTSQRQVIVTLLEKPDKDARFMENWRPISLINVDVKVCSKALSDRIINLLPKLIHPNQAAFVKGRNIEEPLRYISDLFDYSAEQNSSYVLFAADFQKAFDSVEHNFILATLKHFGFGEGFIRWIRLLLTDIKSCIQNNGSVSDFFTLNRGTKQGDPISPYLFILVIEILAELIRNNCDIHGVRLSENAMIDTKLALFADDATFTLKDVPSLINCLGTLEKYGKFSSLKLNLGKSEVGWIGPENDITLLPSSIKKKKDLQCEGIRILGMYFSHNPEWLKVNNVDRVFEKFKSTLNMWRLRNLTLYGKATIVRSLALSQLCFVFSNTSFPPHYVKKVHDEIVKFLWNGKKPKIKYATLINDLDQGGIRLPDLETMIKANRIRWALKFINNDKEVYWKSVCNQFFEQIGGLEYFDENLDEVSLLAKVIRVPKFYKEMIQAWSEVSKIEVVNEDDVLRQPIWFNRLIKLKIESKAIKRLAERGIRSMYQVWVRKEPSWNSAKEIGWNDSDYLLWRAILDAIPRDWKVKLRKQNVVIDREQREQKPKYIGIADELCPLSKVNSKMIYWMIIKGKACKPTAQAYIEKKLKRQDIEWSSVYMRIYASTIDTKLRAFQYKIINNCLYLNQKLYSFRLVESPKCSFCSTNLESMFHFYTECFETRDFYCKCRDWLNEASINFPVLNFENILLGYSGNSFVNYLLVLWKFVLYTYRCKQRIPVLNDFQAIIRQYERLEYTIAKN